ncbi:SusC/RagA family protein [Pedobacter ginsengisoli]|uniref:SusC/RagA family protein n=2 Tax=Pedobacter ginsengisoli TaxID=363852 RepID=A0A2D1U250_9SPHI|nr:SusC/RagA family protein [Pedobacter ginsengisoli]
MYKNYTKNFCMPPGYVNKFLVVMKLTVVLLIATIMQVSAVGFAQRITYQKKNASLKQVLNEINKQTGYSIVWSAKKVKNLPTLDVDFRNASLNDVLDECLKNQDLTYAIEDKMLVILAKEKPLWNTPLSFKNLIDLKGKVVDENGAPLPGATVKVKGGTSGVVTSADGSFTLTGVNQGSIILVSFLGYNTQEVSVNSSNMVIKLVAITTNLDDVVVVAYGSQKKTRLTGAIAQISGKDLQDRPVARLSQALQGQVANLNITQNTMGGAPNSTQNLNIRGYTGFNNAGSPLIVVDGIQGGDINSINPDDVESISVLKDAASAAIYGSSAPYGVILIVTKKGSKDKAPTISYNNNVSMAEVINLPKMVNSLDFANIYNEAFANAQRAAFFDAPTIQRIKDYQAGILTTETIQNPDPTRNEYFTWNSGNANNDWFKVYYKDRAYSQQHNVSVNGGSTSSTYFIGAGYNSRGGMYNYGDDKYKRYNLRANISSDVTNWLTFNLRGTFSRQLFNSPNLYAGQTGGGDQAYMHQIARKFPTVPVRDPNGRFSNASNILLHEEGGRNNQITDQGLLSGEFNFKLAKGWTATANYTFDAQYYDQTSHLKTLYAFLPDGSQTTVGGTTPNSFSRYNERNQHEVVNVFSQYEKQFDDHYFSILGGYVSDYTGFQAYSASNSNLYSDNIPSLSTAYGTTPSLSDLVRKLSSQGAFGRINYNYKEKYLLEFNARYDGTSRFLEDVRWKLYPGVSVGWNVDKESFFEPVKKYVNSLKFRGSYGELGDQVFLDLNYYPFYPSLGTARATSTSWLFGGTQQASVSLPGLVNDQLTWITSSTLNFGVDAAFFNNKLNASFDWYIRKATDFAGPSAALPALLGTNPPTVNNSAIKTKGWELSLTWRDRIGEVSYGLRTMLSDYGAKVTRYPNPTGLLSTYYQGLDMGEIWGYSTVGLFQTAEEIAAAPSQSLISTAQWTPGDVRYADLNGDGKIGPGASTLADPGDRKVIGNSTPRYSYGINADASWKGFDMQVFVQGVGKRDASITSNYFWGIVGDEWQSSLFTTHLDRWTPSTPNGYYPKYYMSGENGKNTQVQTRYLQNAAYLRVKNVQLGYTLKKNLVERIKLNKVRFYFSVDNLATITKFTEALDPELTMSGGKVYPLQRSYSAGVNVTF